MHILAALLLAFSLAQSTQQSQARAEAERLARSGAHAEALTRFQALAAANPDDIEARIWIGRLHTWMGHPARAAEVFESIVAGAPQNIEALVGLATALTEVGRYREAGDALTRAEAIAPDRLDVLAAQGRFHAASGRATLALAYFDRALALAPGDAEIRAAAAAVRASRGHRLEVGYDYQGFEPESLAMHAGTIDLNFRVDDAFRVFALGQIQSFDGLEEGRGGGGFEWRAHRNVTLRGGLTAGGDTWLPAVDGFGNAVVESQRARWLFSFRYADFDGASLAIGGVGVEVDLTPRITVDGWYLPGRVSFDDGTSSETSANGSVGLSAQVNPQFRVNVGYHRGIDRLEWLTADRLLATDANTWSFGATITATPFVSVNGFYDYQDRCSASECGEAVRVHRAHVGLGIRF